MPRSSQSMAGDRARLKNGLKLSPKIQLPEGKRMQPSVVPTGHGRNDGLQTPDRMPTQIRFGIADAVWPPEAMLEEDHPQR